jgi:hypothetical protein
MVCFEWYVQIQGDFDFRVILWILCFVVLRSLYISVKSAIAHELLVVCLTPIHHLSKATILGLFVEKEATKRSWPSR